MSILKFILEAERKTAFNTLVQAVIDEYDVEKDFAVRIAHWLADNKDDSAVDGFMYDHYSDEMPYGTRKARDGDPQNWIADHVSQVFKEGAKEFMKLAELHESVSSLDIKSVIMTAVDIMMVRGAYIDFIDGDEEGINIQVVYEFPEHRSGLPKEIRKALGKSATVDVEKVTIAPGSYGASYTIEPAVPFENEKDIIASIKSKFK